MKIHGDLTFPNSLNKLMTELARFQYYLLSIIRDSFSLLLIFCSAYWMTTSIPKLLTRNFSSYPYNVIPRAEDIFAVSFTDIISEQGQSLAQSSCSRKRNGFWRPTSCLLQSEYGGRIVMPGGIQRVGFAGRSDNECLDTYCAVGSIWQRSL